MTPGPHTPVASVLGHRMLVHDPAADRFVSASLLAAGCFEPFQTELVVNDVRPGDIAVDVGAHVGYYTLLLARLVGPRGKVFAFEPDPDSFALLKHNVAANGYAGVVEAFNAAASDRAGRCRLYRSADNAGDHRTHDSPAEPRPAVEVDVVSIDDVLRDRAAGVDFVKIDVQGAEGAVVDGLAATLGRSPRVKMMVEFWPAGLARAGSAPAALLARLRGLGFRAYEIDEAAATVRRADPRQLAERYPPAGEGFTNLLCVKAPLGPPAGGPT